MNENQIQKNNMNFDLKSPEGVVAFLRAPTLRVAEFLTGVLSSTEKDWKLSAGHLVQATIKGAFLTELGREVKKYQEEGKIKEDYMATPKNRATLYELLKYLDEHVPDEDLFRAMKSIFFSGIAINATAQDEALAYEFLQTAKELSGTEILILKANLDIAEDRGTDDVKERLKKLSTATHSRSAWRKFISVQMGYGEYDTIVSKYEGNLERLGLISRRNEDNRLVGEFEPTPKYRLTGLGMLFCQHISNYE